MEQFFDSLTSQIMNHESIIIMTHKNMDIDGFSSSLCLYNIISKMNKSCYIYMNKNQNNEVIKKTIEKLKNENYEYNCLTDLKEINEDSLLIIVDVYKKHLIECEEMLDKVKDIIVIDHHIQDVDYIRNTNLVYINSNMSSVAEIMTEYSKYMNYELDSLLATIMLCAIEIDTNSFNFKTTDKTYEACAYLSRCGASTIVKQELLRESKDTYFERQFYIEQSYQISEHIIVCVIENKIIESSELAIIADNLLQFEKIEASFAVGRVDSNTVGISARSIGNIDVQSIMSKMGGGGHLTDAATKINGQSIKECVDELTKLVKGE